MKQHLETMTNEERKYKVQIPAAAWIPQDLIKLGVYCLPCQTWLQSAEAESCHSDWQGGGSGKNHRHKRKGNHTCTLFPWRWSSTRCDDCWWGLNETPQKVKALVSLKSNKWIFLFKKRRLSLSLSLFWRIVDFSVQKYIVETNSFWTGLSFTLILSLKTWRTHEDTWEKSTVA